ARTLTPFSSSTLYMPFGRGSRTRPSTSTGGRGTRRDYTATQYSYRHRSAAIPGSSESSHRDPLRHRSVRSGKHTRTVLCDRHRVFEVGRQCPVCCANGPAVRLDVHVRRALVDHRLDRERHPWLQFGPRARYAEVRELRILVHRAPDSVPHELPYHR